ncbi:Ras-related protein Rab-21 [Myotis davidii]|uniref:Ras-related protein Rab-21 n=1 Tax=Myotis davidii TaxID=225400 RepID=L5M6A9_MYODS|nr:Ras-related protein Rab-21 [Myotis davidii]
MAGVGNMALAAGSSGGAASPDGPRGEESGTTVGWWSSHHCPGFIQKVVRKDTAGQERFHALGPIYYRDSNGAILVYDITDEDSFQKVKNWVKELRKMLGNEICLCIVGNKVDLEKERHVSIQEAESYAESVGAKHYHTSAKQNKGIEELFLDLCKRMIETAQVDERAKGNGSSQPGAARRGVQIIDDEPQVQSGGGGCCSSG